MFKSKFTSDGSRHALTEAAAVFVKAGKVTSRSRFISISSSEKHFRKQKRNWAVQLLHYLKKPFAPWLAIISLDFPT